LDGNGFEESISFVMRFGEALHAYGAPAHRLEEALVLLSRRLGLGGQFVSTPTSITASFEKGERRGQRIVRIHRSGVELGKLADLDALSNRVIRGQLSARDGTKLVDAVVREPPRWGTALTIGCYGLTSGASAVFFGGGLREIAVASTMGLAIGLLARATAPLRAVADVFEPLAAFVASALAAVSVRVVGPVSVPIVTLAGLIILFPGLALTGAMTELATRNLVSGTARFAGATVVFLTIGFGVALGSRFGALFVRHVPTVRAVPAPDWLEAAMLVADALAFVVLFRAHARDALWIVIACVLAFGGARTGANALGPELGIFVGALAVGVAANLYARVALRPAIVPLVPGILVLVPGSLGFRSVEKMLEKDVVTATEIAFSAALVAVSLVAGLLVANVVVSPRRAL
jgi:uncharacterized membrane protein YjjP (DUF1212 family)